MGQYLLYFLLAATCISSLLRPWIGAVAAYVFVVLAPQFIWWYHFVGIRSFYIITIFTSLGILLAILQGRIDFTFFKTKINFFILLWFAAIFISYIFGPYVPGGPGPFFFTPDTVFEKLYKMLIFYIIAVLCITDDKKFKYLCLVILFSGIYYIYWTNQQYLGDHQFGRIGGPVSPLGSRYRDENALALFLVISLPFLYYTGYYFKNLFLRYGLWLIIPFGWHAIFLTGSRGALLGLAFTVFMTALRSPKKYIGFLLIPALLIAYSWQAGPTMTNRAQTLVSEDLEESAVGRLESWKAASKMIISHPLTGVGLSSFGVAYPVFSDYDPREAHNTYFQIGAETGVIGLIGYTGAVLVSLLTLYRKFPSQRNTNDFEYTKLMNEAVLVSLFGFAFCSLFLSTHLEENFFYLLILANYIRNRKQVIAKQENAQ